MSWGPSAPQRSVPVLGWCKLDACTGEGRPPSTRPVPAAAMKPPKTIPTDMICNLDHSGALAQTHTPRPRYLALSKLWCAGVKAAAPRPRQTKKMTINGLLQQLLRCTRSKVDCGTFASTSYVAYLREEHDLAWERPIESSATQGLVIPLEWAVGMRKTQAVATISAFLVHATSE